MHEVGWACGTRKRSGTMGNRLEGGPWRWRTIAGGQRWRFCDRCGNKWPSAPGTGPVRNTDLKSPTSSHAGRTGRTYPAAFARKGDQKIVSALATARTSESRVSRVDRPVDRGVRRLGGAVCNPGSRPLRARGRRLAALCQAGVTGPDGEVCGPPAVILSGTPAGLAGLRWPPATRLLRR